MDICLNSRKFSRRKVMLGVSVVAVDGFRVHPAVQFVSVAYEKATGVGAALGCAQPAVSLVTKPVPSRLISERDCWAEAPIPRRRVALASMIAIFRIRRK